jgi:hypothetical protein
VERLSRLLVFVLCVGRPLSCVTTQNLGFFFWSGKSDEKGAGRSIWFFRGAGIGRDSEARDSGRGDHSLPRWGHLLLTMLSAVLSPRPGRKGENGDYRLTAPAPLARISGKKMKKTARTTMFSVHSVMVLYFNAGFTPITHYTERQAQSPSLRVACVTLHDPTQSLL